MAPNDETISETHIMRSLLRSWDNQGIIYGYKTKI